MLKKNPVFRQHKLTLNAPFRKLQLRLLHHLRCFRPISQARYLEATTLPRHPNLVRFYPTMSKGSLFTTTSCHTSSSSPPPPQPTQAEGAQLGWGPWEPSTGAGARLLTSHPLQFLTWEGVGSSSTTRCKTRYDHSQNSANLPKMQEKLAPSAFMREILFKNKN